MSRPFRALNPPLLRELLRLSLAQRVSGFAAQIAYLMSLGAIASLLSVLMLGGLWPALAMGLQSRLVLPTTWPEAAQVAEAAFWQASREGWQGLGFGLSVLLALWALTRAVATAVRSLNYIHGVPPTQHRRGWPALTRTLGLTLGLGLLVLPTLALFFWIEGIVFGPAVTVDWLGGGLRWGWRLISGGLAIAALTLACAWLYWLGPSPRRLGAPLLPGAVLAAIALASLGIILRLYLARLPEANWVFGLLGLGLLALVAVQGSAQAVLMGDQLNVLIGDRLAQQRSRLAQSLPPAPPSFDSFTIRRRANPPRW